MCPCRPTILEDEEFGQVENNLKNLQENLPGADVLGLIEQQVRQTCLCHPRMCWSERHCRRRHGNAVHAAAFDYAKQ